jgi:hypothetical protein
MSCTGDTTDGNGRRDPVDGRGRRAADEGRPLHPVRRPAAAGAARTIMLGLV